MDELTPITAVQAEELYPDLRVQMILERLSQGMLTDVFVSIEKTLDDNDEMGDGQA